MHCVPPPGIVATGFQLAKAGGAGLLRAGRLVWLCLVLFADVYAMIMLSLCDDYAMMLVSDNNGNGASSRKKFVRRVAWACLMECFVNNS